QIVRGLQPAKLAAMDSVRVLPIVEVLLLLADGGPAPWDELSAIWTIDKSFSVGLNSKTHRVVEAVGADKHSVIKMIAVGPSAAPLSDRTDECIADTFINDFTDMFPEARDKILAHSIKRWNHGIPAPAVGFDQHVAEMVKPLGNIHFAGDWCGFVDTANPGGAGLDGDWGGYGISGGLHPAVRAGLRAASEIRTRTLMSNGSHV
ncbi:FAD-dependent oxidoreductase, partial [Paenarthrobacter sp. NEAU-H11]|uniref:FAD-dependent oxidoreductase n=1 Tax=Paenarthrobacter sp. NEAU-H11 TaxID=3423924 RepID=UPI003D32F3F6